MSTSFWTFSTSWIAVGIAVLFVATASFISIVEIRRSRRRGRMLVLEALRWLVMALLVLTLFRPERVRLTERKSNPLVAVLCDGSGSMATRDVVSTNRALLSRSEWLQSKIDEEFWAPLKDRYQVDVTRFSSPVEGAENTTNAHVAAAAGTDLNEALEQALRDHSDMRALILLSDGDWNEGSPPVSAATKLRVEGVPVFSVTVGSDRFLPDLELTSLKAPSYGLIGEHISIPFTVQSRLPREVKTSVLLRTDDGSVVASKAITIPAMSVAQESVMLIPDRAGEYAFTLSVPREKDEILTDNNSGEFNMAVRRELLKVLIIESLPRWEYRYLHNALVRDPGVDVKCILMHPGMERAKGRNYLQSFPSTRDELSKYDVVFLGDVGVGNGELSEEEVEMLAGLVTQQGSGLVFLPGRRGRHATLTTTALEELMPVVLDKSEPRGRSSSIESKLSLTSRGRSHLLTMLASTPEANYATWRGLPGFTWHAGVLKARVGSRVLAVHADNRNRYGRLPLLVTRNAGSGKTLFMGTDSAWKWRRGVEDTYHYRFWGQVVRWMAHRRHLAHEEGIRFFFSPENPKAGETVFLHATVMDESGYPLQEGNVTVSVALKGFRSEEIALEPSEGGWGVFTGSFVPERGGRYRLTVESEEADRKTALPLVVSTVTREKIGRPARAAVLREVSRITRGTHGGTEDLEDIVDAVKLLPEPEPIESRFLLWCHPAWMALLVCLFGAYWVARKLVGLV